MSEPASREAIAALLRAADIDEDPMPTEALMEQVTGISRKLEGELAHGDYVSAQASFDRLIDVYPALNDLIDFGTDRAMRDPLIDVYEAAVALRIKAAGILHAAEQQAEGRNDA